MTSKKIALPLMAAAMAAGLGGRNTHLALRSRPKGNGGIKLA